MLSTRKAWLPGLLGAMLIVLGGCSSEGAAQKGGPMGKGPRQPQVGFVVARASAVPATTTLGGRVVALETSEVRPQVSGIIRRRMFTEGSYVNAGQTLFQIDPSLYQAAVNQASANLASARAGAEAARAKADRYRPLAEMEAISRQDYTDAAAQARQAQASVAQNNAALETARINLRYTSVPAPISGRIGRSLFTVGALVNASQPDPLAVIQRTDPVYVDLQQSSAELVALRRALASGAGVAPGSALVRLKLEDGIEYGATGVVQFSEITVNESTGTVTLRARFPNPQGLLLPGMFVTASFDQTVDTNAFLVPQAALQRDFGGDAFVFLVGEGNKAARRIVVATRTQGADWVVTSGLRAGDRVIVQGLNNLKDGMPVRPVPAASPQRVAPRSAGMGGAGPGGSGKGDAKSNATATIPPAKSRG